MDELQLYEIIKTILNHSTVIRGNFIVAEGYGNDLNTNNMNEIVKDALSNYKPVDKRIPVSVLCPPVELVEDYATGWSRFRLHQFFLCGTGYNGTGEIKSINPLTNTSEHEIKHDWKDMRQVAGDYRRALNQVLRRSGLLNLLNSSSRTADIYRRVSNMGNDKLSGVHLEYELNLGMSCTIVDYPDINTIVLPEVEDNHPLHNH